LSFRLRKKIFFKWCWWWWWWQW